MLVLHTHVTATSHDQPTPPGEISEDLLFGLEEGAQIITNAPGTVTIPTPSGSASVSAGTTISNTGSGYRFSAVQSADVGSTSVEAGQNILFSTDSSLTADHVAELEFQSPQGEMRVSGASGVALQANGDFTIASADLFQSEDGSVIISNAEDIHGTNSALTVGSGSSATLNGARATNAFNIIANWRDTFTVASADVVVIDTAVFRDIAQSTFTVQNGQLQSATVTSARDQNTVILQNPIAGSSLLIQIQYDAGEKFRIELDKRDQGREMLILIPIDDIAIAFGDRGPNTFAERIAVGKTAPDAALTIIEDELPIYRITHAQLNYTTSLFTESLDASCGSETAIHYDAGFIKVVLEPYVEVLCPGGRYSYYDHQRKEKSWSLLNIGNEPFELGLNKDNLLSDVIFLAGLHDDLSHGYANFPIYLELWGIIQYDRFREFNPSIESRDTYDSLNLPFQPIYQNYAERTHALLNLHGGEQVDFRLDNPESDPSRTVYAISSSGMHRITERFFGSHVLRFFDYNKQPVQPPFPIRYASQFLQDKPPISLAERTLDLRCPAAQNVTLYAENSAAGKRLADDLSYLAGITFDAYVKKYGGGIAVVGELR